MEIRTLSAGQKIASFSTAPMSTFTRSVQFTVRPLLRLQESPLTARHCDVPCRNVAPPLSSSLSANTGRLYPDGNTPHYIVRIHPATTSGSGLNSTATAGNVGLKGPTVEWQFAGFVPDIGAAEATPVYEGVPGDKAVVRYFVARDSGGVSLYSVSWSHYAAVAAQAEAS